MPKPKETPAELTRKGLVAVPTTAPRLPKRAESGDDETVFGYWDFARADAHDAQADDDDEEEEVARALAGQEQGHGPDSDDSAPRRSPGDPVFASAGAGLGDGAVRVPDGPA